MIMWRNWFISKWKPSTSSTDFRLKIKRKRNWVIFFQWIIESLRILLIRLRSKWTRKKTNKFSDENKKQQQQQQHNHKSICVYVFMFNLELYWIEYLLSSNSNWWMKNTPLLKCIMLQQRQKHQHQHQQRH